MTPSQPRTKRRSLTQWARDFDSRSPLKWDIALPAALLLVAVLSYVFGQWGHWHEDFGPTFALPLAMWLLHVIPLIWRRRYPVAVLAAQAVPVTLAVITGQAISAELAVVIALFNVALRSPIKALLSFGVLIAANIFLTVGPWPEPHANTLIENMVMPWLFVLLFGWLIRSRRAYQLAQRETAADQAVAAERSRIAQEMHDIIGHNLAVITALADGGAYAARSSPERTEEAMHAIGSASREALSELRRVLYVLQDDKEPAELSPQPGLPDVESLVERVRATGLAVGLRYEGELPQMSPGMGLVVYRVVQESLTNVLRHGSPARSAEVTISANAERLAVTITNTGPVPADSSARQQPSVSLSKENESGQGIFGMRRRAEAYGGTLEAGPKATGGWHVTLTLPT
ncbi:sensor histidine kinase [Natronoglycomyces albus]|uniref:histidine kinase n=1 Tax=Natronoglycomyces albus TaxID=2811108 RepID=A0A895XM81_9ACTN|nr:histidine kinase [Natronoglycomyces albus]QSB04643.1 hypothetical protein JQS30_12795 [Natronoglycomyces albus]